MEQKVDIFLIFCIKRSTGSKSNFLSSKAGSFGDEKTFEEIIKSI